MLNHDDDILWIGLARAGNWLTTYDSSEMFSGSAGRLASEFKVLGLLPLLWLAMRWPFILFQIWRHALIAWTLGIPNSSVGFGYRYLSRGERPSGDHMGGFDSI